MKMGKVIERLVDGGFEAPIQKNMNVDEYENMVERALCGVKGAQTIYLEKFLEVVKEVDEDLHRGLIHKVILLGPEEGVEEFLTDVEGMVLLFVDEVRDRLREFPAMEEPVVVELEDPVLEGNPQAGELIFRFFAPGDGAEPVAEFTVLDPESRAGYVLSDVEFLVAASYRSYLRRVVEDTLHDLKRKEVK